MKLEEWKKFLKSIPDNDYTRKLNYTRFEECDTIKAGELGSEECFVLLNEHQITVQYANAKKGVIRDIKEPLTFDKEGNVVLEYKKGNVKIVKYGYKP